MGKGEGSVYGMCRVLAGAKREGHAHGGGGGVRIWHVQGAGRGEERGACAWGRGRGLHMSWLGLGFTEFNQPGLVLMTKAWSSTHD